MRQRGVSEVVVSIFLLLALVSTISVVAIYNHFQSRVHNRELLNEQIQYLESERDTLNKQKRQLVKPLGSGVFQIVDNKLPVATVVEQIQRGKSLYSGLPISGDGGGVLESTGLYHTLYDILNLVIKKLIRVREKNRNLARDKESIETRIQIFDSSLKNVGKTKADFSQLITGWKEESDRLLSSVNAEFDAQSGKLSGLRDELGEKIIIAKNDLKTVTTTLTRTIDVAKSQLRDLLKARELTKFVPKTIHGKIVYVNAKDKLAYINIGSKDLVKEGIVFFVSRPTVLGIFNIKGKVVVRSVWLESSEVEILEEFDEKEPLIKDDILLNPFFSTDRQLVIAFSGRNDVRGQRITRNEAMKKAIEIGCKIASPKRVILKNGEEFFQLPHYIDFLVYTGPEETDPTHKPEYFTALELGIPVADPGDVFKFLEY